MWTPYRNMIYLGILLTQKRFHAAPERELYAAGRHRAENMVRMAFPALDAFDTDLLLSSDDGADIWPKAKLSEAVRFEGVRFSRPLETFLARGRRGGRVTLDQLILAYCMMGLDPDSVYKEAHEDYLTIDHVIPLTLEDVKLYGTFFWNFAELTDLSKGVEWFDRHDLLDERNIILGNTILDDLRASCGVTRGLDLNKRIVRLAYKNSRVMERILDEMLEMGDTSALMGDGRHATEYIKNAAAFMSSSVQLMKLHNEMTSEGSEESGVQLIDTLRARMKEAAVADEQARIVPDWRTQQRDDLTPEDLAAANRSHDVQ